MSDWYVSLDERIKRLESDLKQVEGCMRKGVEDVKGVPSSLVTEKRIIETKLKILRGVRE